MEIVITIVVAIVVGAISFLSGRFLSKKLAEKSAEQLGANADEVVSQAKSKAEQIIRDAEVAAKEQAIKLKEQAESDIASRRSEVQTREDRLSSREEAVDKRAATLDERENSLSSESEKLKSSLANLESERAEITIKLEKVAGLSKDDAKKELISQVKEQIVSEEATLIRESESRINEEATRKAQEVISVAIQRTASENVGTATVTTVTIPSEDVKGRLIGREGRNIRSFEQITGVNLIVDDTPDVVTLSCFDTVRREVARLTLEALIADGRIHPASVEDIFKRMTKKIDEEIKVAGEEAVFELGIPDLHPELIRIIGRMKFRGSYGQNVLGHSLETANLAATMAAELGYDVDLVKRAGLLHDIGKAAEVEDGRSHAAIGAEMAQKYGESDEIVHSIAAHHEEIEPTSILDVLIQAADALSAARPGARRDSSENYAKRISDLEDIANAHKGVEKTFAMLAGREVRVMVEPEQVTDDQAKVLAHDIAKEIEEKLKYPGTVKVMVIRESRTESVAK